MTTRRCLAKAAACAPLVLAAACGTAASAGRDTATGVPPAQAPDAGESAGNEAATAVEEVLLEVRINRQQPGEALLLLRLPGGRLLVRGEDLQRWRLRLPDVVPVLHFGAAFYPLDALSGLSWQLDEASQTLLIEAAPGLFGATYIQGTQTRFATPAAAPPGGFLNYDLSADRTSGSTHTSGVFELGAFGAWGTGVGTLLAQDLGSASQRFIRLDTTWTRDLPAQLASLRLGDAISSAGSWGRSVRFAGVQWATNFGTRPELIAFPLPSLSGEAALPSTVDLYINNALRLRREVPAGPFSISDLPVVTGQGEARLVVRDLLGREQVIVRPYYASPRLLQKGLHEYSYELGRVRENYGLVSNDYGRALAVGTHRLGLSPAFTGEVHAEVLRDQQTAGLGGALLWADVGVLTAALAGSRDSAGTGGLLGLGFDRLSRHLSFGGSLQVASERFRQLGLPSDQPAPRQLGSAFVSVPTAGFGSFALSYTHQAFRDREDVRLVSANYGITLAGLIYLSLSLLRSLNGDRQTTVGLNFTVPLSQRTSATASATTQQGSTQAQLQLQRNLPAGSGVGYRLIAGSGQAGRREAGVSVQTEIGTYTLEAARFEGETAVRARASGGVALLGGSLHLSRSITDGFAVVQVPGYPNVRIYGDNTLVARTDADGNALLPRLRPYQKNPVRIEQSDLPLDTQIDATQLDAVPYFRSGLLLRFPARRSRGALITVVLENGAPLPAGAVAQINGVGEEFPVGLHGELYLTGLDAENRLRLTWRAQSCEIKLAFPQTSEPLPHLGRHVCAGVQP